jgi:hypothetical protein
MAQNDLQPFVVFQYGQAIVAAHAKQFQAEMPDEKIR